MNNYNQPPYNNQNGYQQQGPQQQNYQQQGYQQGGYQQNGYQQGGYRQPYQRPYIETTANNPFNQGPEGKSRGVFALLALIVGSLGIQYFYINKVGAGIITILLTLVTCGAWAVIPVIQGIVMLWNMTNEEFDRKFVASNSFMPLF